MASPVILSNFFEKQWSQNHPQYLSGLSRALYPTTFLKIAVNYQGKSLLKENVLFTTNNNGNNKNAVYSCLCSDVFSIHPRQKKANKRNKQLMLMKIDSIFPFVYYFNFVVNFLDILLQLTFSPPLVPTL